ncbi:Glycosyltransferase involved in cell wall bisynthesis [Maribacter sedimenticola]|uniref:Glycosyltransferase involved in cell wall bisynthesis n=1 Tax=Maribacter sedimenticola TaxID=228956 RepID=A0ABY1SJV5_9FLAO|nr:glycosyltransferase family 4 protein [Maribacter sedimenticola]SNR66860.1 Glycosyltransferase involved in cell wall bisynthesis [Maribacter sedimenticola]
MKIALLLSRIEQTGVTTHTLDLTKGLIDEGHEVFLITGGKVQEDNNRIDAFYEQFISLGAQVKIFKTPKGSLINKAIVTVSSIFNIIKLIKSCNPDIIHAQSPYMTFIPWLMGKNFTTTIHNTKLKKNIKFKNPTHLIAISKESEIMSQKVFGISPKDITIVNHGVSERFGTSISESKKNQLKDKFKIPKDKIIVGFVGRLTKDKGCDILFNAIKKLNDTVLSQSHFIFVGSTKDSADHQWLRQNLEEKNIDIYCSIVDFQDPKPFYDIFDIFVLPSRFESFPLVILEAMMSECATVRSQVEGALEQIHHGVNGMLFPNEDVNALSLILQKLILNDAFRTELANKGKSKALKEYTIPVMTKNTLKVYDKIRLN